MSCPAETMSSVQSFRDFLTQRLTAAAVEIFSVFEQTVVRYEQEIERQRRLLDIRWKPKIKLHRIENADQPVWEENQLWDQEKVSGPDPDEPLQIKEEDEDEDVEPGQSETRRLDQEPPQVKEEPEPPEVLVQLDEFSSRRDDQTFALKYDTQRFMRSVSDDRSERDRESLLEDQRQDECLHSGSLTAEEPVRRRHAATSGNSRQINADDDPSKRVSFGNEYKLNSSLKENHQMHSGEKPFLCKLCGKAFRLQRSLCLHMRTHTGEKPHSCETCGRSFSDKGNLLRHTRIHTGEKPYSCATCGKSFRQQSSLSCHVRTHTGEKPYSCKTCGKTFSQYANLFVHRKKHVKLES